MAFYPAGQADRSPNDRVPKADNLSNGFSSERTEYKLYVANLPSELNEDGIRQIFNSYGEVTGVLSPRNAGWAYVTYKNHREAVLAIGSLDDKSPLHLKVEFSKERQTKSVQDWTRQNLPDSSHSIETTIAPDYRNSGGFGSRINTPHRKMEISFPEGVRSRHVIPAYDDHDEILYPVEPDPRILNPFENAVPYPESNLLWTRGRVAVTGDGRRHVYMGRGYTVYKIPEPYHPRMEDRISAVYETRTNGLYEYGVDQLQNEVGRCELCDNITKMRCGKCSTFYCSRVCQKTDWDKHKTECQALPPLTGISNALPSSVNGDDPLQKSSNIRVKPELKERVNMLNQKAKETLNLKQQEEKEINTTLRESIHGSPDKFIKINKEMSDTARPKALIEETSKQPRNDVPDVAKLQISSPPRKNLESNERPVSCEIPQNEEQIERESAFQRESFLFKDKFTQVIITVALGNGEYWVQRLEDEERFAEMMSELANVQGPKVKPVVGDLIACKFFDIWNRASIVSLNPLIVHYIDFGNDEILTSDDIRPIGAFGNIPRFARKIRVHKAKGTKYEMMNETEQLSVKVISEDENEVFLVITPDLEGESPFQPFKQLQGGPGSQNGPSQNRPSSQSGPYSQDRPSPQSQRESESSRGRPSPKTSPGDSDNGQGPKTNGISEKEYVVPTGSVIDNLEVGDEGMMEIHTLLRKNTYSVTIVPNKLMQYYQKILCDVPEKCAEKAKTSSYQPKNIDEYILGKRSDNDWIRGRVMSVGPPVKLASVDEGRVYLAEHCLNMPPSVAEICTFGATCILMEASFKAEPQVAVAFEVVSHMTIEDLKGLQILIKDDNSKILGKAFLSEWVPPPEQAGVKMLELKSETEVVLTAYRTPSLLYVRSLETKEVERFNRLLQEVARKAQTAPRLKNTPVVGEIVIAKYQEDGNYYRAIVTKVNGDDIHITYTDYGNVEISSMKYMWELPSELKLCPSGAARIFLKGVPTDVPLTEDVSKYFALLVGREQPLKIVFDGIPSKDGVELKSSTESINEKVQELLTPDWKKNSVKDEKTCFMISDLEVAPLGNAGDTVDAMIVTTQDVGRAYFVSPNDYEMITHVMQILPGQIEKYVANTPEHYIPRDLELCVAPFENLWYRAACLSRNATPTTSKVFFVDFGNIEEVDHKDLRLMTKDFMSPAALANICIIQNLLPEKYAEGPLPKNIKDRLMELLPTNESIKIKIVNVDEHKNYTIELPEVRDILVKENLI